MSKIKRVVYDIETLNLTPKLTLEQEFHNKKVKRESKLEEYRYKMDCFYDKLESYRQQYILMKDKVETISPEDKIKIWLPKWIDYIAEYSIRKKEDYEKGFKYLDFYPFIATQIAPHYYGLKMRMFIPKFYIEYVV